MQFPSNRRQRSLSRKLALLVSLFTFIVVLVFLLGTLRSAILTSVRAYIQGEGYWSKGQKEAVISLTQYAASQSPADFQAYLAAIRIPLGDKMARMELEKPAPDMEVVTRGFTRGRNDPVEIPGMARFFRWFHGASYMHQAIAAWTEGDAEIDQLTELADELHAETFEDHPNPARISEILEKIEECDSRLTLLEDRFSASLVAGDTWISKVLNGVTLGTSALLLILGIATSQFLLRNVRRSEEKYRRLVDSANDAIVVFGDESGTVVEANDRAAELFGIPAEILLGSPEAELFPPDEKERAAEILRSKISSGEGRAARLKIRKDDGRVLSVNVTSRMIQLAGDGQRVILAIFRDTSELERLNRGLLALSRCNQELVQASEEVDLFEKICSIIVNAGGYRLAWVALPEPGKEKSVRVAAQYGDTGGYLNSIKVSWADDDSGHGPVGTAIRTREICTVRNTATDPKFAPWAEQAASQKFNSVISLPLLRDQTVIGALNIYSEEVDNVFEEEEVSLLRELATNLAFGISTIRMRAERERAEKDVQSLEEQLRQAQKMESLGRLAGGVAHDFNNLLTIIRGYAELAMPVELLDSEAHNLHRKITEIMKASDRAQGLIGQLLAFSRKQILQPRVLDLNQILLEMGTVLPRLIGEDVQLKIKPGAGVYLIKADPNQIQQVIMNLAVNARDAMTRGGTLTVQTANVLLPSTEKTILNERVLLTVSDTGTGIPPEVRSRIFEPFFTTKDRGKGTGLGLAMVYGTVKQSGGHIEVESKVDEGTTFKLFFLPTAEEAPLAVKELRKPSEAPFTETILLVEDDPSVRELVREFLSQAGFQIIEAANGTDGLEKAKSQSQPIDLVITDIVMPGMGGRELAEHLKLTHPETRILFMSGYTDDAVVRQSISSRLDHFIEKPFKLHALADKIREVLNAA